MTNDKYANYVYDLGVLLKEKARDAKVDKDSAVDTDDFDYKLCYLMAFHDVISVLKQQADVFDIDQVELGLKDIEPESELL